MNDFASWFDGLTGFQAHSWQQDLALDNACASRTIRVPTGLGKTKGVLAAWFYNRIILNDPSWPRRLVWCLPMRVLVEQTEVEAREFIEQPGLLWHPERGDSHSGKVGVHVLMGGADAAEWQLHPDACAVLVGTQDMLLSRTLNRGYGTARARWPMEFGLLNQDCLWVMDEVQLMDVGLTTSSQLQAFRHQDQARWLRPCHTWWMSATLQRDWLVTVDTKAMIASLPNVSIAAAARKGPLWQGRKPCRSVVIPFGDGKHLARWSTLVREAHTQSVAGPNGRITLVVVNTVDRAVNLHRELRAQLTGQATDLRLVHSRFRGLERKAWRDEFLSRDACTAGTDRIIVTTQVVEAGVDISATTLITELAPWPSLVQRFGRAARYGGEAQVIVVDGKAEDDKAAAPYSPAELRAAAHALHSLEDVALQSLEEFEMALNPAELKILYPYAPLHVLLRRELDELFDTTPDLTGSDLDISRFIRSGDERDLQVCWLNLGKSKMPEINERPPREMLCPVPFLKAQVWLCDKGFTQALRTGVRAWVWDYLDDAWRPARRRDLYPGQLVVVDSAVGGYDATTGFDPDCKIMATQLLVDWPKPAPDELSDVAQEREDTSLFPYKTIATHGVDVSSTALSMATQIGLPKEVKSLLGLAGRWHDVGKSHPAFQGSIEHGTRPQRQDLAKAPKDAWPKNSLYRIKRSGEQRPSFRHELASAMALFAVLERCQPEHPALLGPHLALFKELGWPVPPAGHGTGSVAEQELLALTASEFDLCAYLVCAHHGKIRCAWHASPQDQDYQDRDGHGLPVRGVRDGDKLPSIGVNDASGIVHQLPEASLNLEPACLGVSQRTGESWTERVSALTRQHGPFVLAFMEALLRAADIRASALHTEDPLLEKGAVS